MNGSTRRWQAALIPVLAVLLSLLIGAVVMVISGYSPLPAYAALFVGAFGTPFNIATTLAHSVPLMLTGLGVAIAFRSGLFNIGAEGQFWAGSIATTWVGYAVGGLPPVLHVTLALLAGAAAGAVWAALIPGLLKAYTGAHEVITTMMMTYVAIQLSHFLLEGGPMQAPGYTPVSPDIRPSAFLPLLVPRTQLSAGLFIALGAAVIAWLILERTTLGYRMRAVGFNARAAAYAGIDVAATTVLALGLSGAFAGVAGAVEVLGVNHRLYDSFTAGYGFTAIVVALLAKNDPWATLGAALLFGALSTGASYMQLSAGVPSQLVDVVQGIIIFFIAADAIIAWLLRRSRNRKEVAV